MSNVVVINNGNNGLNAVSYYGLRDSYILETSQCKSSMNIIGSVVFDDKEAQKRLTPHLWEMLEREFISWRRNKCSSFLNTLIVNNSLELGIDFARMLYDRSGSARDVLKHYFYASTSTEYEGYAIKGIGKEVFDFGSIDELKALPPVELVCVKNGQSFTKSLNQDQLILVLAVTSLLIARKEGIILNV